MTESFHCCGRKEPGVATVPTSGAMGYDEDGAKDALGQDTLLTGFAVEI